MNSAGVMPTGHLQQPLSVVTVQSSPPRLHLLLPLLLPPLHLLLHPKLPLHPHPWLLPK